MPPWNRIDPATVARLAGLGYRGLSTFANQHVAANVVPLAVINTHVDLMAWKGARGGRDWEPVARDLTASLQAARAGGLGPVGLLTHHLVHDQVARDTLSRVLDAVAATNAAIWVKPGDVFAAP